MTETVQPEWLKNYVPGPPPPNPPVVGNPGWHRGMKSPNPSGRPKGIVDKRMKVTQALMDDAVTIARVVIDAALDGDLQAAALVLARVSPALRSQLSTVEFDFDANASVSGQVEQVLAAIAQGQVAPDAGRQIIDAIAALSNVRATEELERRLQALEERQV